MKELFIDELITEGRKDVMTQMQVLMRRLEVFDVLERIPTDPYFAELAKRVIPENGKVIETPAPVPLPEPTKAKSIKSQVLDMVRDRPGIRNEDIHQALVNDGHNVSKRSIRWALSALTHGKTIQRKGWQRHAIYFIRSGKKPGVREKAKVMTTNIERVIQQVQLSAKPPVKRKTQTEILLGVLTKSQYPLTAEDITKRMVSDGYEYKGNTKIEASVYACIRTAESKGLIERHEIAGKSPGFTILAWTIKEKK